MTLFLIDLF